MLCENCRALITSGDSTIWICIALDLCKKPSHSIVHFNPKQACEVNKASILTPGNQAVKKPSEIVVSKGGRNARLQLSQASRWQIRLYQPEPCFTTKTSEEYKAFSVPKRTPREKNQNNFSVIQ